MKNRSAILVLALLFPACESFTPAPPEEVGLWSDASGDVADARLASLAADVWEYQLRANPFEATTLGDPRYHGEVPDASLGARDTAQRELADLLGRARSIDPERLNATDATTLAVVTEVLTAMELENRLALYEWTVDPVRGLVTEVLNLAQFQPTETARERAQMVERWRKLSGYVRMSGANLRRSKSRGWISSKTAIQKALAQVDGLLDTPPMDNPLVEAAKGPLDWVPLAPGATVSGLALKHLGDGRKQRDLRLLNLHLLEGERIIRGTRVLLPSAEDPIPLEERGEFVYAVLTTVERDLYPAFAAYRETLAQLAETARPDAKPGLAHLTRGKNTYAELVRMHTTLPLSAEEIHQFGLDEVARIRAEIADLGERVFGTRSVSEIQGRLRSDPQMFFASRDEVSGKAVEAVFKAERALPQYFGILPVAACEVLPTPTHEEANSTIAYYLQPKPDGSRPGRYYVNTYEPETRPRYDAEVLAYHEALPGHHLQIAIAQELDGLPLIRRHSGFTAYVEGWALYTERLCQEMGLYSGDTDLLGVLSFDAWRASRLVVDTGLHHLGWSRQEAIDYLFENTLLARNNCENEVDRYIAWPGQALAYKIGQREILDLRAEAEAALGQSFDIRDFHDRVLEAGSIPLSLLAERVRDWIAAGGGPTGA